MAWGTWTVSRDVKWVYLSAHLDSYHEMLHLTLLRRVCPGRRPATTDSCSSTQISELQGLWACHHFISWLSRRQMHYDIWSDKPLECLPLMIWEEQEWLGLDWLNPSWRIWSNIWYFSLQCVALLCLQNLLKRLGTAYVSVFSQPFFL